MRFVEDDGAVKIAPQPIDDLLQAAGLLSPLLRTKRRIGREQDSLRELDRHSLPKARQWRDQQPLLPQSRPVALRILEQLVGLADPQRLTAALKPIVENDAGDLAPLPCAG